MRHMEVARDITPPDTGCHFWNLFVYPSLRICEKFGRRWAFVFGCHNLKFLPQSSPARDGRSVLDICASVNTLIPFQHLPFLPSLVPFFERSRHSDIWSRSRWDIVAGIRTATNLLHSSPQSHSQRKRDFLWRWLILVIQWVEKFKLCNKLYKMYQIFRSNQPRVVLTTSNTYPENAT